MSVEGSSTPDVRMSEALERVYDSGQNVLSTRLDLLVAELGLLVRSALLELLAALLLLGGLGWLSYALYRLLALALPGGTCAGLVGLGWLLVAAALLGHVRRSSASEGSP